MQSDADNQSGSAPPTTASGSDPAAEGAPQEIDLEALEAQFAAWPLTIDGVVYPSEMPRLTQDVYDRAVEQWVASLPARERQVRPPSWLIGRPLPVSLPVPVPEPDVPIVQPQWFACFGRRDSDQRAYIGLGVIEPDGSEREERYHPATNTRLHALLERYLVETSDEPA
jgi:hypothetical protein